MRKAKVAGGSSSAEVTPAGRPNAWRRATGGGRDLLMIRTHRASPMALRMFDRYAAESGLDVTFACDERNGPIDMGGRAKFGFDTDDITDLRLYAHPDAGWRCGDYFHYFGRRAHPEYARYWLIEPDVWINVEDLRSWFAQFTDDDADLLVSRFGFRKRNWNWFGTVSGDYDPVHGCVFPITRLTAAASDHLLEARRAASVGAEDNPTGWPNDEAFVANELVRAGFACRDLNAEGRTVYSESSFLNGVPHDVDALIEGEADGLVYHPAQEFEVWLGRMNNLITTAGPRVKQRGQASRIAGAGGALIAHKHYNEAAVVPLMVARAAFEGRLWSDTLTHLDDAADRQKLRTVNAKLNREFVARGRFRRTASVAAIRSCEVRGDRTILARPEDFNTGEPQAVWRIPTRFALPYCWDLETHELLLTLHLSPQQVLEEPFLYGGQRKLARVLARVPLDKLDAMFGEHDPSVSPLFIYSIGRTGSTLLDSLVRCATPRAVSEPDTLTQLASAQASLKALGEDDQTRMLWHSVSPFFSMHLEGEQPSRLSLKFRSQVNALAEQLTTTFPMAKSVFMLRRRGDWARSTFRAFGLTPERAAGRLLQGVRTLARLKTSGADLAVLWYEDVVADPRGAVARILDQQLMPEMEARIDAAMNRDSQAGTGVSRDKTAGDAAGEAAWLEAFEAAWETQRPASMLKQLKLDL